MKRNTKNKSTRLDSKVMPLEYKIELKPDLENFTFSGVETITVNLLKPTKILTLHSKEIEIITAQIKDEFAKISYNTKNETATFKFPKIIPKGEVKLTLVFTGILNDKMRGFYRSQYSVKEKVYHMATTQFEATDARRAFPCFDEPAQKAVFHVSLIVPRGKTAISNTLPISKMEHESDFEIIKFSPTPKMSTYLLAFIVGDFEYVEKKTKRGVQVRVFTTQGKKHQAKFSLDCAVKTLDFYEEYFDIKYPMPNLDMIAVPDFDAGAMENWGAITYRENALLVDEGHSSASSKQRVALIVAHELAHQWFGNLVTMEWWTHLWLNEGFASYIEYLAVDKLFPGWDIWTQFSVHDLGVALRLDALVTTHPIEIPVRHPDEIGEIFDAVSYSKGASIIRMLASYIGENNFRDGLRYYLKKHSYRNTETIHLWQAFEKVSGKKVAKMMHNWTSKPGYPVVKAEIKNGKTNLTHERFFSSPISKAKSRDTTKWEIPTMIEERGGWTKVNIGETGFYRTAYSKELLEKLKAPVLNKKLSPRDRLGIIRDLFALSEAGLIPTTEALEFLSSYRQEDDYTVWVEIASGLSQIEQMLANSKPEINLKKMTLELFSPIVQKLGWNKKPKETHTDVLLRSLAISRMIRCGDKRIIKEAKKRFESLRKGKRVDPDTRSIILAAVALTGGVKDYNTLVGMYKAETLHEERDRIGAALGDFQDTKILNMVCDFALSSHVRIQDTVSILTSVAINPTGRDIWMKSIKSNWKTLISRYGGGGFTLSRLVKGISGSSEEKHLREFKSFFKTHEAPGAKRSIDQVLERIESNIAWRKRDSKKISKLLNS